MAKDWYWFTEKKVEWFGILSKNTALWLIENEFATRPWSYNKQELLRALLDVFSWDNRLLNKKLICLHQIYISPEFRKTYKVFDMLRDMFLLREQDSHLPVVMETRYDSRFFPITKKIWFNDILSDKYWYVIQYMSKYIDLSNFLLSNQGLTKRKFYI